MMRTPVSACLLTALGWFIVYSPIGAYFGFVQPTPEFVAIIIGIVLGYLALVQLVKMWFAKKYGWK